jgi:hypothetical protein
MVLLAAAIGGGIVDHAARRVASGSPNSTVSPSSSTSSQPASTRAGTSSSTPASTRAVSSTTSSSTSTSTLATTRQSSDPRAIKCATYAGTDLDGFVAAGELSWPAPECLATKGERLRTTSTVQLSAPAVLDFQQATITGAEGLTGPILDVGGGAGRSKVLDVTLTSSGGDGIDCEATCALFDDVAEGLAGNGVSIGARANGSRVGGGAAAPVTVIGDAKAGVSVANVSGVTLGYIVAELDNHYGVVLKNVVGSAAAPCLAVSIAATDTGNSSTTWHLPTNNTGAAVELLGTTGCRFDTVTGTGQGGYGLALGASSDNTIDDVAVAGEPSGQLNPGVNLSTGSAGNFFGTVEVTGESVGLDIGNNGVPGGNGETGNNRNTFTDLEFAADTYGAINIIGGTGNTFSSVVGTAVGNAGGSFLGLIQFDTNPATHAPDTGNVVRSASFTGAPAHGYDLAPYVVYSDARTSGNSVTLASVATDTYGATPCEDVSGGNDFKGCS